MIIYVCAALKVFLLGSALSFLGTLGTLRLSRTEDRAPLASDLSADPEAGKGGRTSVRPPTGSSRQQSDKRQRFCFPPPSSSTSRRLCSESSPLSHLSALIYVCAALVKVFLLGSALSFLGTLGTLRLSRTEDRAPLASDLSADPEAGKGGRTSVRPPTGSSRQQSDKRQRFCFPPPSSSSSRRLCSESSPLSHLSALKGHEHRFVPGFAITRTASKARTTYRAYPFSDEDIEAGAGSR